MLKKIITWLHLWLGLASGAIVVILSLTGCILVFEQEIKNLLGTEVRIAVQDRSKLLPPSVLYREISRAIPGRQINTVWYYGLSKPSVVALQDSSVYINPYTAKIISFKRQEDIFHFIEEGHRHLWMGKKVGKMVVGCATLVFVVLLLTGLVLWWPKKWNKKATQQNFKIKWGARIKRFNYDLHNVLGFYSLTIALLLAITGLVISFTWFSNSIYWLTGGRPQTQRPVKELFRDSPNPMLQNVDQVWYEVRNHIAVDHIDDIIVSFPDEPNEAIYACTDMKDGIWRDLFFNPVDLSLTKESGKQFKDLIFSDKVRKLNYAMHVGAIGGLTTKIIFFLVSLICASLPITGFYIWWFKRKKG
ncbi:PepSY-associated TM helix domain-containing protein [Pedobacter petrophilus]|nr:PepSY-associated TM helix domain-containing protein [Pedobacter petrophilus]